MTIRGYSNTAPPQVLASPINNVVTSIPVGSTNGYPTPPFTLGIERGTPNQEVCLCTSIIDPTHFGVTRGYNGTTGLSHAISPASAVELVTCALDYTEANAFINLMTANGDIITQIGGVAARLAAGAAGTMLTAHGAGQALTWTLGVSKYAVTIGDGSTTAITVNHALGSTDVIVQVYEATGAKRLVIVDTAITDANNVLLTFATAPATNAYRAVVSA